MQWETSSDPVPTCSVSDGGGRAFFWNLSETKVGEVLRVSPWEKNSRRPHLGSRQVEDLPLHPSVLPPLLLGQAVKGSFRMHQPRRVLRTTSSWVGSASLQGCIRVFPLQAFLSDLFPHLWNQDEVHWQTWSWGTLSQDPGLSWDADSAERGQLFPCVLSSSRKLVEAGVWNGPSSKNQEALTCNSSWASV